MIKKINSIKSIKYQRRYTPLLFSMLGLTPFSFTKDFNVRFPKREIKR